MSSFSLWTWPKSRCRCLARFCRKHHHLLALWLVMLVLYSATTARDVLPADAGEFQLVAAGWGIAHPPGYPLYTLVGALWVRFLGILSPFIALNLLSAALAATTVTLTARAAEVWLGAHGIGKRAAAIGAATAGLLLGSAATVWSQATQASIRTPTLLLAAWGYLGLARYRAAGTPELRDRRLRELAIIVGLAVGHHPSLIFIMVGWLVYLLALDRRLPLQPRRWLPAAGLALVAWAVPQLYLPLRDRMAAVPLGPGTLSTWSGFWDHVLARGFGGDMFAFASLADLAQRLPLLPSLLRLQFYPLVLALMAIAWLALLRRDTSLALGFGFSWALHTFVTTTYRAPQTVEYLMPAYLPMVLVLGIETGRLYASARQRSPTAGRIARWAVLALPAVAIVRIIVSLPDFALLALDRSIRERTEPLLKAVPADAVILADWHWATPLWALAQIEGTRPDVTVQYVLPSAEMDYDEVWQELGEAYRSRPLFSTRALAWEGWNTVPVAGGYQLLPRPLHDLPEALGLTPEPAMLGPIELLGYHIDGTPQPGKATEITLAWRASGPQDPAPSFTIRLWGSDGTQLAQVDQALGTDTAAGELRFTHLSLQLPVDRCSDKVTPSIGVYTVEEGSFIDLGSLDLPATAAQCTYPHLPTEHPTLGVVLPGGPWLRGVDYDIPTLAGSADAQVTAYLHWCGPGQGLRIQGAWGEVLLPAQSGFACQTVRVPVQVGSRPELVLSRLDGTPARLVALPLPVAPAASTYVPFGDRMVLVGLKRTERGGAPTLDLTWRVARPLVEDYAVSVRLLDAAGGWIGMHDMQPGLGALPTLKWVTRGSWILDPHPFPDGDQGAERAAVVVYERFRLSALATPQGDVATLPYPH